AFPNFDIGLDLLERRLIDDGSNVGAGLFWKPDVECRSCFYHSGNKLLVGFTHDNEARERGAFLTLVTECRLNDAKYGLVQIGIRVDDHRVLATHFADDLLQVPLIRMRDAGQLPDLRTDLTRSGEGHKVYVWMHHEQRAYRFAISEEKIGDTIGQ